MRMSTVKRNEYFTSFGGRCAFCGKEVFFRRFFVDKETDFPICPDCRFIKGESSAEEFKKRLLVADKILKRMPGMMFEFEKKGWVNTDGERGRSDGIGVGASIISRSK